MNQSETSNKMARAQMICAGAALSSVIEAPECQEWLRTQDGQRWLSGIRMALECGDPLYLDYIDKEAERYDEEFQAVTPRCAA